MQKEILISVEGQEKRVAVVEGGKLEEFYVERTDSERLVGNIYKGLVNSIVIGIQAAFIDVGLEKNGFLYVSDIIAPAEEYDEIRDERHSKGKETGCRGPVRIESLLRGKQEILVQVVKEPIGGKGPRLTTHITLPGRYLVWLPTEKHIGVSKRIADEQERERLKAILREIKTPKEAGIIVRTAGEGRTKREFERDLRYLSNLWRRIKQTASRRPAPSRIHEDYDLPMRVVRDFLTEGVDSLIIDCKDEYRRLLHFVNSLLPQMRSKLVSYKEITPLFERKNIEREIQKLYDKKVYLKSGGHIVIEQTEGLVAIDVNTGKYTGKKDLEETVFMVNMEAVEEIARQIRQRDIGGIIVVDFIDMELQGHREQVFNALVEAMKRDKAKTNILPISEIGIVEMTRQRMRKSIESKFYEPCSYCAGRGSVKSVATMAVETLRAIKGYLRGGARRTISVRVHPGVATRLFNEDRGSISSIENMYKAKVVITADPSLRIEEVRIEDVAR
jgi:ribonuclease G